MGGGLGSQSPPGLLTIHESTYLTYNNNTNIIEEFKKKIFKIKGQYLTISTVDDIQSKCCTLEGTKSNNNRSNITLFK